MLQQLIRDLAISPTCLAVLRTGQRTELRLTDRERQIAELVAQGLTNREIGAQLWITQNSVKQALKRIFQKLEISARTELAAKIARSR